MDCKTCLPDIDPANEDAEQVYLGGPVAINHTSIHAAMDLYQVEFPRFTFEQVVNASRYFINKMNEESKNKKK